MGFQCPTLSATDSTKNKYSLNCAHKYISINTKNLDNIDERYINQINTIEDPILRHISIYFVKHYIDGYNYYHKSDLTEISGACGYLNRWLEERRDLFTYGERCHTKMKSWDNAIKALWDMLKKEYPTSNNNGKPWCDKYPIELKTIYPVALTSPNCNESIPQEIISTNCPLLSVKEECVCPQNSVHEIPLQPVQAPETDRTKNLAVTSGFTAVGTLGTLFFLYRFTPMMSWFRRPGMNNVGTDLYMNPGGAESFLSMQQDNGSNNLFYHP